MNNIDILLNFVKFTIDFKKIKRDIPQSSSFIKENDSEHSYQLAMTSWYLANIEKSNMDIETILKYSLIHDLPEIYAGDTPLYTLNTDYFNSKKNREEKSTLKIKNAFPNFVDLNLWLEKYEKREDEESKFVYAVDKLLPIIAIYLDKGYAWKTHKIDIDSLIKKNKERVLISPMVSKYS